jgi:sugar-specific transcriptional regulator TrmB
LPSENDEYLGRLGLTEQDQKVYVAILDSGLVSVGETKQLTELALGSVLESIRDLVDIGLVKKAHGRMPRYYAALPFFRETISIEREAMFTIESMLQALSTAKDKIEKERSDIQSNDFPKLIQEVMDQYYELLLSPTVKEFEETRDGIRKGRLDYLKELKEEGERVNSEFKNLIKPLKAYSDLQLQKFDMNVLEKGSELEEYTAQRKGTRFKTLKTAHSTLGTNFDKLNAIATKLEKDLSDELNKFQLILQSLETSRKKLVEGFDNTKAGADTIISAKNDFLAESLVTRQRLVNLANEEVVDPQTGKTTLRGVSAEEITENFDKLSALLKQKDFDLDPIEYSFEQATESIDEIKNSIEMNQNTLKSGVAGVLEEYSKIIKEISDEMSSILTSINEDDDEALDKLKSQLTENISKLGDALREEGKEISQKINDQSKQMDEGISNLFNTWQDKIMVLLNKPIKALDPLIEDWVEHIKPAVDQFTESTTNILNKIIDPVKRLEEKTYATLIERLRFIKAIIESRDHDLQTVMEFSQKFDYTKSSDTWIVTGLPSIYASLTDLLLRSRVKVTVVTPRLDLELIEIAKTMKPTIRITMVADIDKVKDARILRKIEEEEGRIVVRSYEGKDLYACMRDSEEIIFGYEIEGEPMIGIRSSTPSMVELLEDRLNETVIRNSKAI